jgi:hypothetical protein
MGKLDKVFWLIFLFVYLLLETKGLVLSGRKFESHQSLDIRSPRFIPILVA